MKILQQNNITAVDNSADNVLTLYPKQKYTAAGTSQTLKFTVSTHTNAIYIGYTNATTVTWKVLNSSSVQQETGSEVIEQNIIDYANYYEGHASGTGFNYGYWIDTSYYAEDTHYVELTLTADTTLEVGIVRAGLAQVYYNPNIGFSESQRDFDIVKELASGDEYRKSIGTVRTFNASVTASYNDDYAQLIELSKIMRGIPMAYQIVEASNLEKINLFGRLGLASGSRGTYSHGNVNITITESI